MVRKKIEQAHQEAIKSKDILRQLYWSNSMKQNSNNTMAGLAIFIFILSTCSMLTYHCGYTSGFESKYHEKNIVMLDELMKVTKLSIDSSERCLNVLENSCSLRSIIKK